MEREKDYVWISKIYDVISLTHHNLEIMKYELRECGIVEDDLERMQREDLFKIVDGHIQIENKIYDYIKPDELRSNWIYLEPMTRRRFLKKSNIPNILDIIVWRMRLGNKRELFDIDGNLRKFITEKIGAYNHTRQGRQGLKNLILNYYSSIHKDVRLIANEYLSEKTIQTFSTQKNRIHVIDKNESCPLGLNKDECESHWRQSDGLDLYAYKDFHLQRGGDIDRIRCTLRLSLSRYFGGVYFHIMEGADHRQQFKYAELIKLLEQEEVLSLLRDAGYYKEWQNAIVAEGIIQLTEESGFIPVYKRTPFTRKVRRIAKEPETFENGHSLKSYNEGFLVFKSLRHSDVKKEA